MSSVTGSILTGTQRRPDIFTISMQATAGTSTEKKFISTNHFLNKLGYIPVISTITGLGRALLGVIHTIVHLVRSIFDAKNRAQNIAEAKLGALNIGRGLVEMVPFIGNLIMFVVDSKRMYSSAKQAYEITEAQPNEYKNSVAVFAYGKMLAKLTNEDYDAKVAELPENTKLSPTQIIHLARNKV